MLGAELRYRRVTDNRFPPNRSRNVSALPLGRAEYHVVETIAADVVRQSRRRRAVYDFAVLGGPVPSRRVTLRGAATHSGGGIW
jgi:hypothetical protein